MKSLRGEFGLVNTQVRGAEETSVLGFCFRVFLYHIDCVPSIGKFGRITTVNFACIWYLLVSLKSGPSLEVVAL